jgi:H+/gluconate symporter-like permease
LIAACPLVMVGLLNLWFTSLLPATYGKEVNLKAAGFGSYGSIEVSRLSAIWAVECALVISIGFVLVWVWKAPGLAKSISTSVMGAMLAGLNTGSEYGFGAVISSLPGFQQVSQWLSSSLHDTLINVAVTTNILAGVTGSASGGMSIALAAMSETYLKQANAAGIPPEVLHRVAAMASGGMDSLPHNGALITLLAVTGLTHREAYPAIFGVTVIKTMAVFFVIALYYVFGIV